MKERPILFSAPMVRALLNGRKTQTRRAYKNRKHPDAGCDMAACELAREKQHVIDRSCPYGRPGDRLWVRETHRPIFGQTCGLIAVDYQADPREKWERLGDQIGTPTKWTPSIHMRREYSRIQLEIVSVRIERLNDISYEDAISEGMADHAKVIPCNKNFDETSEQCARRLRWPQRQYENLWNKISGAGSWDANPWVWAVEFKRVPK